ncbi:SufS family cysteine desulfurase [Prochlorococcus sp. MIT 1307]|uniref:SufS family cysteine desulfurase n=1 Tax=Prochlorococcus sp. MIT 1307 TaxID=3096219 RepID=UPI002A765EEE|nr:SufS family cysteine desulfurase [Prochlorococcus sp. MIT 1307]
MANKQQTLAEITRRDFPLFRNGSNNQKKLIYLDHAATSQKPSQVIEALKNYYSYNNANVHRGAHQLSARATEAFEEAREITASFIGASLPKEILFTRNATEAINIVARSWGDKELQEGDEILLSLMEHHSNLVPWQQLSQRTGCILRHVGITQSGELDLADLQRKLSPRTRLVSLVHISNTLGCCNPISEITEMVHSYGAMILIDACQSLAHTPINVQALNIDFLAGSSHKLCGPTGAGFLWAREEILENMPPFLGGGEMIQEVFLDKSTWAELPHKFEAGTPAVGEAIGMGEALKYLKKIGLENIHSWEKNITEYLFENLNSINGVRIFGPKPERQPKRGSLATFSVEGIHANDIAELLDANGICIRSGHHCCQPLHRYYKINATARASISFTSTINEIDFFIEELTSAINFLKNNS